MTRNVDSILGATAAGAGTGDATAAFTALIDGISKTEKDHKAVEKINKIDKEIEDIKYLL